MYLTDYQQLLCLSIKDHPELSRKYNGSPYNDLATDTHNFNHPIVDLLYMGVAWNSKYSCAIADKPAQ